jgi:hypothetical protein|nr:MAG TPA: hypothetical protein [Caudoviricetes sp.]DAX10670.1 MAG TPA: hypothetical protein [Caudoviricetes sp.]
MEKIYESIINEGKKNGESIEVINTKLKEAGANFHLNPDGGIAGWSEKEMAEGFIPAETEPEDVKHLCDIMRYKPELAGQTMTVTVAEGRYEVTYNANGNPVKAVRVNR